MDEPIAIVGGGIAGASAAYHVGRASDAPVVVFERCDVGNATTAKSTAVFRLLDGPTLTAMKRDALALYNRFLADPRADPGFELIGRMEVATTDDGAADLGDADLVTGAVLDGDELPRTVVVPELDADAVVRARYDGNAGTFRPAELAHEFAARAREAGVEFRTDTEVVGVETEDGRVAAVRTSDGTMAVSHVVAAAGPWNREVAGFVGLDLPVRHTLAPILRLDPATSLTHTLPNLKHHESGYYFVGQPDGTVLVGHSPGDYETAGRTYDPDAVSESVPDDIVSGMTDVVRDLLPALRDATVVDEWVGVRSLTPDGLPMVGPTSVPGFSVVAFNSEGIQLAPGAGRVLAAHLGDADTPAYAPAVSPLRFDDT